MPHPVRAGVGGPPSAARARPTAGAGRPLPAGVGLQVQRAELVDADDHLGVAGLNVAGAVHQPIQVQDPVLLSLEVRVARLLPGLQALKRHALLAEQDPQALVADVVDHPLSDQELGQLGQRPGRKRQRVVLWARQAKLLDRSALGQGEGRRAAAAVARVQRADSSTIWARRQVTTDPELRRTIRSSRLPSSLLICRTRTRSATLGSSRRPDVAGSLHQVAAKRATSYFNQTGPTLPAAALTFPGRRRRAIPDSWNRRLNG
jgi:hypothetical protein